MTDREISLALLQPITKAEADALLSNKELRKLAEETDVDLGMIVSNMQLTVAERWRRNTAAVRFANKLKNAELTPYVDPFSEVVDVKE